MGRGSLVRHPRSLIPSVKFPYGLGERSLALHRETIALCIERRRYPVKVLSRLLGDPINSTRSILSLPSKRGLEMPSYARFGEIKLFTRGSFLGKPIPPI